MTTISVIIATYGNSEWATLAEERAYSSIFGQFPVGPMVGNSVVLWHEDDGTRASSLNHSVDLATGDWLIFLDADDELAPGYVGAMRRALEQATASTAVLFTPAVQTIRKGRPGAPTFFGGPNPDLRSDNWLVIGTMIHRDLFRRVGGFDEYPHGFEDFALWSKCHRVGAQVVKVPDAVYRYFWNPQSAHKRGWRDRRWQVATHQRVVRELDAWEAAQ